MPALTPPSARRLAFGAGAVGLVNIGKAGVQVVMLPLMAHLLTPGQFGLYALALPAVALFSMLADGGLGASLARETEAAPVWSTAFWALLAAGVALALGLSGWGVVLARIAREPALVRLMALLSVSLVLLSLSVCPMARLTRQGRLGLGAGADFAGTLGGAGLGLLLAAHGFGAVSLAAQYVCGYAIRAAVLNAAAFHRPRLEFHAALLRGHLGTGSALVGTRVLDFGGRMAENTLLGVFAGTGGLGLYTFSNQLSRFLTEGAGNPVWSALYVQALGGEARRLPDLLAQLCRLLALILFPMAALIVAAAPALVPRLLGQHWVRAVPVLQIVLPSFALNAIFSQSGAVLLARGRFGIQLYCVAGLTAARILAVCSAPLSALWGAGLLGPACGVALANTLYAAAMLVFSAPVTFCRPGTVLAGLAGPAAASLCAGAVTAAWLRHAGNGLPTAAAALLAGAAAFLAVIALLDRARLRADWRAVRRILHPADAA